MCLQPGEEIGDEVRPNVDQFFRIEQGEAKFVFNEKDERRVPDGDAVMVPAGTYHNVVNTSKTAMLKLYTIYSPPGTRHSSFSLKTNLASPCSMRKNWSTFGRTSSPICSPGCKHITTS